MMTNTIAAICMSMMTNAVSSIEVEASAFFSSRKVERGLVENRDPVCGCEAEIGFCGFNGGIEACYDMTDINGNKGRYNEITSHFGYEKNFNGIISLGVEYIYKDCNHEGFTQEIQFETEIPTRFLTPYFSSNIDIDRVCGAFYGNIGVKRDFTTLYDTLKITPFSGIGFGNARRNAEDFDCNRNAARDICIGVDAEIELYDNLFICGTFAMYDQFTKDGRDCFEKGFFVLACCSAKVSF